MAARQHVRGRDKEVSPTPVLESQQQCGREGGRFSGISGTNQESDGSTRSFAPVCDGKTPPSRVPSGLRAHLVEEVSQGPRQIPWLV